MKKKCLVVTMPDGEWAVPVEVIARHRAEHYAQEFGGDIERSLSEDTLPFFAEDEYEASDWARNNMNWDDVADDAKLIREPLAENIDRQDYWVNGEHVLGEVEI